MRKAVVVLAVMAACLVWLAPSEALAQQPPPTRLMPGQSVGKPGAVVLSLAMPGAGEWFNRDFAGSFPFVECIGGYICCLIQLSSSLDAAAGDQSEKIRIDFWSKPMPER